MTIPNDLSEADPVALIGEPLAGVRVMVVDDLAGTATLIAGALEDAGAMVDVTRAADTAIAQARRHHPSAIIVHLPLPKDGAAALCRRIRADNALAATVLAILSGEDVVDEASAAVADIVQSRPMALGRLVADVARLLHVTSDE